MKYEDKRMEMMKERSSAVAMMVLHMSSQMVSAWTEGEDSDALLFKKVLFKTIWTRGLTLDVFFLTEAFLCVAVAGSVASLDPVSQASFVTADDRLLFNDSE